MIEIIVYALIGIIFIAMGAKIKLLIDEKDGLICKVSRLQKIIATQEERIKIKQEKIDALKMRYVADYSMAKGKN